MSLISRTADAAIQPSYVWVAGKNEIVKVNALSGAVELRVASPDKIRSLSIDDVRHIVWMGGKEGGFYAYDFMGNLIRSFTIEQAGATYEMQVDPNVTAVDDDVLEDFQWPHDDLHVVAIAVDKRDGSLWVGAKEYLLKLSSTESGLLAIPIKHDLKSLALDIGSNTVWAASAKGIIGYDTTSGAAKVVPALGISVYDAQHDKDADGELEVESMDFDLHLGQLWVGVEDRIMRFDRQGILQFQFDVPHVKTLSSDGTGNVWVADKKRLYRYSAMGVLELTPSLPVATAAIMEIKANVNDSNLWVLSHKALSQVFANGTVAVQTDDFTQMHALAVSGDVNPPSLQLASPKANALVPKRPPIELSYQDIGVGVDLASVTLDVNGSKVPVTCTGDAITASCTLDVDLLSEVMTLTLKLKDRALNESNTVSVIVKLDSDGDGVADERDTYPNDPSRWRLATVTNIQAGLQDTAVQLQWAALSDAVNTKGYNVYRQVFGQTTETKLNTTLLTTTSFIDSTVSNGIGYRYRVVAVDQRGYEGDPGTLIPFFVAYNNTPVADFSVQREKADGRLSWSTAAGFRYQIYRGDNAASLTPLLEVSESTYLDNTAAWDQAYYYAVASIAEFTDVFTNQPVAVTGPQTAVAKLEPLPPLGIMIDDASSNASGLLELVVNDPNRITVSGHYTEAVGPVDITATSAAETLSAVSSDGTFHLVLPVSPGAQWQISVSEQTVANRSVSAQVQLIQDTEAPTIQIDGASNRSVDTEYLVLTGTAVDTYSGVADLYLQSDRFAGQSFGIIQGAGGSFSVEAPLEFGDNVLTVFATDKLGNQGSASVIIKRASVLQPRLQIISPLSGAGFYTNNRITVSGVVYTSLKPEQVKISLGTQQQFPTQASAEGAYAFSFANVPLAEGYNRLTVNVDSPAGKDTASTVVYFASKPPAPAEIPPPRIDLSAPRGNGYFNDQSVIFAGSVTSTVGISNLSINGVSVPLTGQTSLSKYFQYELDLSGFSGDVPVTIIATDIAGKSTTVTSRLNRDTTPPNISVSTPGVQASPTVNRVIETPYILGGSVTDASLAAFTINGQPVGLVPGATPNTFDFSAALNLPAGEQTLVLEAKDLAGNATSQELIFNADIPVQIEMISPREGAEFLSTTSGTSIQVTARLTGLSGTETLHARIDDEPAQTMLLEANVANVNLTTTLNTGEHKVVVEVHDSQGQTLASTSSNVTFRNRDAVKLEVDRTEPANAQQGVNPEDALTVYFNKAIDPTQLTISVKETVHGLDYDLSNQKGVGFTALPDPKLVEVHRDMEPVPGGLALFPGNRMVSFHAQRRFAYNADIYVDITYAGENLSRLNYKIRPLPTQVSGVVQDQYANPVADVEVQIEGLGISSVTDGNGNFSFGFGVSAAENIPGGRYRLLINPGMKNPLYGTLRAWADLQQGRLNQLDPYRTTRLNPNIPYVPISSGQANVLLSSTNLQLDLSAASILMPNGRSTGNVHAQFLTTPQIPFTIMSGAVPLAMYGLQPSGIRVQGAIGIRIKMPMINNSFDYIPTDGTLVVMLGLNEDADTIEPIGVGEISAQQVHSLGNLNLTNLDYIGFAIVDTELQPLLENYRNNGLSLSGLKNGLEDAVAGAGQ